MSLCAAPQARSHVRCQSVCARSRLVPCLAPRRRWEESWWARAFAASAPWAGGALCTRDVPRLPTGLRRGVLRGPAAARDRRATRTAGTARDRRSSVQLLLSPPCLVIVCACLHPRILVFRSLEEGSVAQRANRATKALSKPPRQSGSRHCPSSRPLHRIRSQSPGEVDSAPHSRF